MRRRAEPSGEVRNLGVLGGAGPLREDFSQGRGVTRRFTRIGGRARARPPVTRERAARRLGAHPAKATRGECSHGASYHEQLRRQTGRVRKEVEQQGRRVRVAWVRRVRRRTTGQRAAAGEGEDEGVDEGVDAAGEQGEARRRGAPLAGMANSSPVETPSGSPATSCGRV